MLKDTIYATYKKEYKKDLIKLHKIAFSALGEKEYDTLLQAFQDTLDTSNGIIALDDKEILGFQLFEELEKNSARKEYLERKLYWAQHPECENHLKEYYQKLANQVRGKVIIEYFKNQFTTKNFAINNKDLYIDTIVIHPEYRKKGIGRKLIEQLLESKLNASSLYVDCLQDSGTETLYSIVGFKPIIRLGPTHISGHSSLMMGSLRKK